jgi:hypothetical protein
LYHHADDKLRFNFNGTGTLITASIQPTLSGAGMVVYEINGSDACLPQVLSEKCTMYGYDTISFTAWQTSTYVFAVANMSTSQSWALTLDVAYGTDAIADPELPAPFPDPVSFLPESVILPDPLLPATPPICSLNPIFIDTNGDGSTSAALDTANTLNSSCLGTLMYIYSHSVIGNGNISIIDVCTDSDWVADVEATQYDSPETCTGACIARGEVLFDKKVCNSSFSGRFTRIQFFSEAGQTYVVRVMTAITPDNPAYRINVTSKPPAVNKNCFGATYLGARIPAIVAGNTNDGGLLSEDCQIGMDMGSPNLLKKSLWHKLIGNGKLLRANACGRRTDFAARIMVHQIAQADHGTGSDPLHGDEYCRRGSLQCVGQVDCSISNTGLDFLASDGFIYFVVVTGASHSDSGFFEMTIETAPNVTVAENIPVRTNEPLEDAFVANVSDERLPTGSDQALFVGHHGVDDLEASFGIFKFGRPGTAQHLRRTELR